MDFDTFISVVVFAVIAFLIYLGFAYPVISLPLLVLLVIWMVIKHERNNRPPYSFDTIKRLYTENQRRKSALKSGMTSAQWESYSFDGLPAALPFREFLRVGDVKPDGEVIGCEHKGWRAFGGLFAIEMTRVFKLPKNKLDLIHELRRGSIVRYEGTASYHPPDDPEEGGGRLDIHSITNVQVIT